MKKTIKLLCIWITCFLPVAAVAQQTAINGVVSDPQGAVIASAKIRLQLAGGGVTLTTTSNASGRYSFPSIAAGDYVVKAEVSGFAPEEKHVSVICRGWELIGGNTNTIVVPLISLF